MASMSKTGCRQKQNHNQSWRPTCVKYYIYIYTHSRVPKLIQSSQEAKPSHRGLVSHTPYACKVTKQKTRCLMDSKRIVDVVSTESLSQGSTHSESQWFHGIQSSDWNRWRVLQWHVHWQMMWNKTTSVNLVVCWIIGSIQANIASWQSSRWPCTWVSYGQKGQSSCPPAISASCFHM